MSGIDSDEDARLPQGDGDRPRKECCDEVICIPFVWIGLIIWQDTSNKYGEFGCSDHLSTKRRRLSFVTSKPGVLGSFSGGFGGCGCCGCSFRLSHMWSKHSFADILPLKQGETKTQCF